MNVGIITQINVIRKRYSSHISKPYSKHLPKKQGEVQDNTL